MDRTCNASQVMNEAVALCRQAHEVKCKTLPPMHLNQETSAWQWNFMGCNGKQSKQADLISMKRKGQYKRGCNFGDVKKNEAKIGWQVRHVLRGIHTRCSKERMEDGIMTVSELRYTVEHYSFLFPAPPLTSQKPTLNTLYRLLQFHPP